MIKLPRNAASIIKKIDGTECTDIVEGYKDTNETFLYFEGDPKQVCRENPIIMMRAVRYAALINYDLDEKVYEAIANNWRELEKSNVDDIRVETEKILLSDNAGKGLTMLAETGLMAGVFGEEISSKMGARELQDFYTLCENIDKTKNVVTRRWGLLLSVLNKNKSLQVVERLNFDETTKEYLVEGINEIINIQFLNNRILFKRYLRDHGLQKYNYVHNLSKAQRIVFNHSSNKIEARNFHMDEITRFKEPVFVEDLVITLDDILKEGIAEGEKAEDILFKLTDVVHKNPINNKKEILLNQARKFAKSKIAMAMSSVTLYK